MAFFVVKSIIISYYAICTIYGIFAIIGQVGFCYCLRLINFCKRS